MEYEWKILARKSLCSALSFSVVPPYIWLSFRHWNVPDLTPMLDEPWPELPPLLLSMLLVRRISCAAESIRLRINRMAGLVAMPLRLEDLPLCCGSFWLFPRMIRMCVSRAK
uniref:(northern house mosquito) hypothetical protein n=1 Tax=Culex pipiens TaxID=7175 RepID=A0A8D8FPQ9_CULPI